MKSTESRLEEIINPNSFGEELLARAKGLDLEVLPQKTAAKVKKAKPKKKRWFWQSEPESTKVEQRALTYDFWENPLNGNNYGSISANLNYPVDNLFIKGVFLNLREEGSNYGLDLTVRSDQGIYTYCLNDLSSDVLSNSYAQSCIYDFLITKVLTTLEHLRQDRRISRTATPEKQP